MDTKVLEYNDNEMIKNVIKNTGSMMASRRYFKHIPEEEIIKQFLDNMTENLNSNKTFFMKGEDSIYVLYYPHKLKSIDKIPPIQELLTKTTTNNTKKLIILQSITPKAIKQIESYNNLEYELSYFLEVNITKNILNSKFILLSEEEQQMLLKEFGIEKTKLPVISKLDRMAKYLDLQEDEIVMILRPSKNACFSPYFRICKNVSNV